MNSESSKEQPIIGDSRAIKYALDRALKAAQTDFSVLILGEKGTGKELIARFIHDNSERTNEPFRAINCASLPEHLIDLELFGIEDGVATGAKARPGIFESTNGGTVFLDEIGDMPYIAQAKILRVLQEREVKRIGSQKTISLDIRIVAATNKITKLNDDAVFRGDLYDRLNEIPITLPPLRDRSEDILSILMYYLRKHDIALKMSRSARFLLESYTWPGNVRELKTIAKRIFTFAREKSKLTESDIIRIYPEIKIMPQQIDEKRECCPTEFVYKIVPKKKRCKMLNEYLKLNGEITRFEYQKVVNASPETALRDLQELVSLGTVSKEGSARAARYVVIT